MSRLTSLTNALSAAAAATLPPAKTAPPATPVDKNMFLQLLVAQMRHQDPLHPQDGTQFLAQLAQFQQLETSLNSSQDLAAIRSDLDQFVNAKTSTGASNV